MLGFIVVLSLIGALFWLYERNKINELILLITVTFLSLKLILFKLNFPLAPTLYNFIYLFILYIYIKHVYQNDIKINKIPFAILFYVLSLIIYIILIDTFRKVFFLDHIMLVIHYFWGMLLFVFLKVTKKHSYFSHSYFDRSIVYILLIYSILAFLQYSYHSISQSFLVLNYEWGGESQRTIQKVFEATNVVTGTMFRMASFGNLMALLINYIVAKKLIGRLDINNWLFLLVVVLGSLSIVITGIRTSLASLLFGLILNFWFFKRKVVFTMLVLSSPLLLYIVPILIELGTLSVGAGIQTENPLVRVAGLFYIFSGEADLTNVTLVRSLNILDVIKGNWLFGAGTFYKSGYPGILSPTDAFLLFHIAELGLIGLTFLLFPYFYLLKYIKSKSQRYFKLLFVLFSVLLLQTVTDNGLFYLVANMLFWLIVLACYNDIDPNKKLKLSLSKA